MVAHAHDRGLFVLRARCGTPFRSFRGTFRSGPCASSSPGFSSFLRLVFRLLRWLSIFRLSRYGVLLLVFRLLRGLLFSGPGLTTLRSPASAATR